MSEALNAARAKLQTDGFAAARAWRARWGRYFRELAHPESEDARIDERAGVLGLARTRTKTIEQRAALGMIEPEAAAFAVRMLRSFADDVAQGLHLASEDTPRLRAAGHQLRRDQEHAAAESAAIAGEQ